MSIKYYLLDKTIKDEFHPSHKIFSKASLLINAFFKNLCHHLLLETDDILQFNHILVFKQRDCSRLSRLNNSSVDWKKRLMNWLIMVVTLSFSLSSRSGDIFICMGEISVNCDSLWLLCSIFTEPCIVACPLITLNLLIPWSVDCTALNH